MADKLSGSPTGQVVDAVNDLGLERAAKKFHTSPSTLSRWLKAQHYKLKRIYVRVEPEPPADDPTLIQKILNDQLEAFGIAEGAEIEMGGELR